ncbi:MAG TPA: thiosulfate oxidation carrier protein SoxY [Gemmatimonadales bacterium]|jgi:sulfur-oxidizing protein SoxY|nr:thiosulfate oxidation carrier protein SoxY [Gemmatimonadales bacterium]
MALDEPLRRRSFLKTLTGLGALLAAGGLAGVSRRLAALGVGSQRGAEPDDPPIPNETVGRIYQERFGDRRPRRGHVVLDMPELAEDGRYVPVAIESDLPMTEAEYVKAVYLIVDHNPDPLVTAFHLSPALGPVAIQTRIKMKRTSWIRAIVETSGGELWADYKKVETTLNGCG